MKQCRRCTHATWSLDDLWAALPWSGRQDRPHQNFLGYSGHMDEPSWDLSIPRSDSAFRTLRYFTAATLSQSDTARTLSKNPICADCTWDSILSVITQDSWPWIRIGTKTDLKLTALQCLETPILRPQEKLWTLGPCLFYRCRVQPSRSICYVCNFLSTHLWMYSSSKCYTTRNFLTSITQ